MGFGPDPDAERQRCVGPAVIDTRTACDRKQCVLQDASRLPAASAPGPAPISAHSITGYLAIAIRE